MSDIFCVQIFQIDNRIPFRKVRRWFNLKLTFVKYDEWALKRNFVARRLENVLQRTQDPVNTGKISIQKLQNKHQRSMTWNENQLIRFQRVFIRWPLSIIYYHFAAYKRSIHMWRTAANVDFILHKTTPLLGRLLIALTQAHAQRSSINSNKKAKWNNAA